LSTEPTPLGFFTKYYLAAGFSAAFVLALIIAALWTLYQRHKIKIRIILHEEVSREFFINALICLYFAS